MVLAMKETVTVDMVWSEKTACFGVAASIMVVAEVKMFLRIPRSHTRNTTLQH